MLTFLCLGYLTKVVRWNSTLYFVILYRHIIMFWNGIGLVHVISI